MDKDFDLFSYATDCDKHYRTQCEMGLRHSSMPAWIGHVRSKVIPMYRRKVERTEFTAHDVQSAAHMLKMHFEQHMAKEGLALS